MNNLGSFIQSVLSTGIFSNFMLNHGLKWPIANEPMVSKFSFGLVAISYFNEILVLLAQTFFSMSYYFGLVRTYFECKAQCLAILPIACESN